MLALFRLRLYIVEVFKVDINNNVNQSTYTNYYLINRYYEGYRKIDVNKTYNVDLPTKFRHKNNFILVLTVKIKKNVVIIDSTDISAVFTKDKQKLGILKRYSYRSKDYYMHHNLISKKLRNTLTKWIEIDGYKFMQQHIYINNVIAKITLFSCGQLRSKIPCQFYEMYVYYIENQMNKIIIYDRHNVKKVYIKF